MLKTFSKLVGADQAASYCTKTGSYKCDYDWACYNMNDFAQGRFEACKDSDGYIMWQNVGCC